MKLLLLVLVGIAACEALCPTGAIESPLGGCYLFTSAPLAFMEAEQQCTSLGGHLASVANGFINAFLAEKGMTIFPTDTDFWVGGNDLITANVWQWTDKTPFSFKNWGSGMPSAVSSDQCIAITSKNGQWKNVNCYLLKKSACAVPEVNVPTCPPPPSCPPVICPTQKPVTCPKSCPSEWTYFSPTGQCYKVFHNKKWSDAEAECVAFDSHLVSIHSDAENIFVANLASTGMKVVTNHMTWIGLYDASLAGDYKWSDGSKVDYLKWAPKQPSDVGKENCVQIFSDVDEWPTEAKWYELWNDYSCDKEVRAFVCKKRAI